MSDELGILARHVPPLPAGDPRKYHLPRPVVLDARLRLPAACKLLQNFNAGNGRRPWIVASPPQSDHETWTEWTERKIVLEEAGARVVEIESNGGIDSDVALLDSN